MDISELKEAVKLAQQLQKILSDSPQISRFLDGKMDAFVPEHCLGLMSVADVAKALKVNVSRVYEYIKEGKFEVVYTPPTSKAKITIRSVNRFIEDLLKEGKKNGVNHQEAC